MLQTLLIGIISSQSSQTWSETMRDSYVTRCEAYGYTFTINQKAAILSRLQEEYIINTFGPLGLNKSVCDFFMFLENSNTTTAIGARTIIKTGATLRWNYGNNNIYTQNYLPDQINNGVITCTSTDGFNNITRWDLAQRTFINNNFPVQFLTSVAQLQLHVNANLLTIINNANQLSSTLQDFRIYTSNINLDVTNWTWPSTLTYVYLSTSATGNIIRGDISNMTINSNAFNFFAATGAVGGGYDITGVLKDWGVNNSYTTTVQFYLGYQDITSSNIVNFRRGLFALNLNNNLFNTAALDSLLLALDNYFVGANTMTQNCTITLNGTRMGSPTGGGSNVNLLSLIAKATVAGRTWIINVNT